MFCVRIEKLVAKIKDSLDKDQLHPQDAAKLAEKINLACSWVFGKVGKALLKPLFTRQHCGLNKPMSPSSSLKFALVELTSLLP